MSLRAIPTPAVLIDRSVIHSNITTMQQAATEAGMRLRPHAKTHKSPAIAGWQLAAGAVGITVAKVGEAEVFAEHGVGDIRIAYPLPVDVAPRVAALMTRTNISIVVDNAAVAAGWSEAMMETQRELDVLIKVDVGFHRCGIDPEHPDAVALIGRIADLPGLRVCGILSHAGHAYAAREPAEVGGVARREAELMGRLAAAVRGAGIGCEEISVGSTPTARHSLADRTATELRPGNYVFFDRTQVALGAAGLDQCALSVLTTVVSRPAPDRMVLDAGSKTLSSDTARGPDSPPGFGAIVSGRSNTVDDTYLVERLSEEHAVVSIRGESALVPGDRVRVLPNHSCVVANLTDTLYVVEDDTLVDRLPVEARGRNA